MPLIHSDSYNASIMDGKYFKTDWLLNPKEQHDTYYVNNPRSNSKVTFQTDRGELSFNTRLGRDYNFLVVVNNKDTCHIRIRAKDDPRVRQAQNDRSYPDTVPFTLIRSRAYLTGMLNGRHPMTIQFDLGAGGTVVNKMVADKLGLNFDSKTIVKNSQGTNEARNSLDNTLKIGNMQWKNLPVAEVGNMDKGEDIIIGNYLFREKIIELDYDRKLMIVSDKLPEKAASYKVQPVFYAINGPKFEVTVRHNQMSFTFWFGFDTGRDGTMRIGQDFTGQNDNWNKLQALTILGDGRKIIRLDAIIAGMEFRDIVTNATDPHSTTYRSTIFGNQLLNHFNMILDNQEGMLYLTPNGRSKEPYSSYADYLKMIRKQEENFNDALRRIL